jgi:hypothetical protein
VELPEPVALKFGAYTLACHHFVSKLSDLGTATQNDRRQSIEGLCSIFDDALAHFFRRAVPTDLSEAASQLVGLLRSQTDLFRRTSPALASIFDDVAGAMASAATKWDFRTDIERMHDLGRALAVSFYARSPQTITQTRCQRLCQLELAHGLPDEDDDWPMTNPLRFDYGAAPIAFRPKSGDIVVRFTFKSDLKLYLAYPFLFLHEYTAHVFATDHGNDRFNDGWMLYAADAFMTENRCLSDSSIAQMPLRQVNVFAEQLYPLVKERSPISGRGCLLARNFETLVTRDHRWFDAITYDLAAFEPDSVRRRYWPTECLNRLEQELDQNPIGLRAKLAEAFTVSELFTLLSPV